MIVVPVGQTDQLNSETVSAATRVIEVPEKTNGYIEQQISKLQAHGFTDCEQILFVDSDCAFFEECSPSDFMVDGKPILLKTSYDVFLKHQKATGTTQTVMRWKKITEDAIGFPVEFEWMRRIPMMHLRETLVEISKKHPKIESYCRKVRGHEFSEFNFIGAFADRHMGDRYHIQDTESGPLPRKVAEQYWSWGGMSDELREHLKCTCL